MLLPHYTKWKIQEEDENCLGILKEQQTGKGSKYILHCFRRYLRRIQGEKLNRNSFDFSVPADSQTLSGEPVVNDADNQSSGLVRQNFFSYPEIL